jgi:hypothetical protein
MIVKPLAIATSLIAFTSAVNAADIRQSQLNDRDINIVITGKIELNDADLFEKQLNSANFRSRSVLWLNSIAPVAISPVDWQSPRSSTKTI